MGSGLKVSLPALLRRSRFLIMPLVAVRSPPHVDGVISKNMLAKLRFEPMKHGSVFVERNQGLVKARLTRECRAGNKRISALRQD
uniref:Uncharacterized protein n=1 Tax=Candidatus Kentrum sp. LFY TaxID=2126342 RepID=A0A450V226_9GAMM|nr:MAG: hypothetical protein BECKLFY1418B_GA0070995_11305 [Candidatus Kentron sp. LFY]